jgi:S-DNA-T family DNA segregation ATPase FtsK/SpoIIIE
LARRKISTRRRAARRRSGRSASKSQRIDGLAASLGRTAPARWIGGLLPDLGLSAERKRDLMGLLLVGLGMVTALNWLTPGEGALGGLWLSVLRRLFGLAAFGIPFILLLSGLWLLLRNLGERIPRLTGEQIAGAGLLFLSAIVLLQVLDGPAVGRGGGWIGQSLLSLLVGAFGGPGAAVALTTLVLVGITFAIGVSISDLAGWGLRALRFFREGLIELRGDRPAAPRPHRVEADTSLRREARREKTAAPAEAGRRPAVLVRPERAGSAEAASPEAELAAAEVNGRRWTLPTLEAMLEVGSEGKADEEFDRQRARLIEDTLTLFGAPAKVVEVNRGPTITQFGVEPAFVEGRAGKKTKVKVSKVAALADDLALALAAPSIRIEAPAPGKGFIGIEVPNAEISLVALRDVMDSEAFRRQKSSLRLGLGRDVSGRPVAADLATMPHLLIAGTTGSGKSVCVNALVACLLLQNTPDDLRFLMIDPKRVELTYYNGIPHLLTEVVVELDRVVPALQWISRQMDERYRRFSTDGVRNIVDYNERQQLLNGKPLPYIAVVIDELADLMMMAPDETERVVTRLAQLARATGIHLIIATQRPSVDVVTGLIKANFPARIAFAVASSVDSRVIIDQPGAERLLGRGDMLYQAADAAAPMRMQGSYVSEPELQRLIRFWQNAGLGGEQTRPSRATLGADEPHGQAVGEQDTRRSRSGARAPMNLPLQQKALWEEVAEAEAEDGRDELFDQAVEALREAKRASISLLQRRLRIGYTRAARLIDQLEEAGIVGPAQQGSAAREVLDYGQLAAAEGD